MNALTVDSLHKILGREVEEIHLTIAKASAMGLNDEIISNSTGVPVDEVRELMDSQDYKDVRLLVGSQMLQDKVEGDSNWDGVEQQAVKKLRRKVELENDTDTLLRIAAVANRATRRTAPPKEAGPLDPSQAGQRVPLTLTRRYTEKLNHAGQITERSETQEISVLNGSAVNPKFEDVKALLSGVRGATVAGDGPELKSESRQPSATSEQYIERVASNQDEATPFSMTQLLAAARRKK